MIFNNRRFPHSPTSKIITKNLTRLTINKNWATHKFLKFLIVVHETLTHPRYQKITFYRKGFTEGTNEKIKKLTRGKEDLEIEEQ